MDPALIFIIIFIVAPLIERLLKASRQKQPPDEDQAPAPQQPQRRPPRERPRPQPQPWESPQTRDSPSAEDSTAADMLPDDLWEILTGEKRSRPAPEPPRAETPEPHREWERELEARAEPPVVVPPPRPEPVPPPRKAPPGDADRARRVGQRTREPAELRERRLPSVETRRLPRVEERRLPPVRMRRADGDVDRPLATRARVPLTDSPDVLSREDITLDAEARHARFHDRLARLEGPAVVQRLALHELAVRFGDPIELRRAIIMSEVLGPPRGLD